MASQSQSSQPSSSASQNHQSASQQRMASREEFLWRRKLEMEEQAFDTIARINALQDKLSMIEEQKQQCKQTLVRLQATLPLTAVATLLARRPQPDLRLMEWHIKRLIEEEGKTKADLLLAQHMLDSLNAKVAHLELEISLL